MVALVGFSSGPQSVSVTDAYGRLGTEGHVLLDVRTRDEVRAEGIAGALNIPLDRLEIEAARLKQYGSIHVICRSGGRSSMATNLLHDLGLTQATNVIGGIIAWQKSGLPIVRSSSSMDAHHP
ncbi:MAG: rhodanese-like domain-containing protein [Minisyncoccota bacterium]